MSNEATNSSAVAKKQRSSLKTGATVKLIFQLPLRDAPGKTEIERIWVSVTGRKNDGYVGTLSNEPGCDCQLRMGDKIVFGPEHVFEIFDE